MSQVELKWYQKQGFHNRTMLTVWQESGRTHEECCECQYQYVHPTPCGPHPEGPVACRERWTITPEKIALERLEAAAWSINVWMGDQGKKHYAKYEDVGLVDFMYQELQEIDKEVKRRTEFEL